MKRKSRIRAFRASWQSVRALSVGALLFFFGLGNIRSEIVYKNWNPPSWVELGTGEAGQTVVLGGTNRLITRFSAELQTELPDDTRATVRLRFYSNPLRTSGLETQIDRPETVLYDSGSLSIPAGSNENQFFTNLEVTNINVLAPDFFTWTLEFEGTSSFDKVGRVKGQGFKEVGSTMDDAYDLAVVWGYAPPFRWAMGFGIGSFNVAIEADGHPITPPEIPRDSILLPSANYPLDRSAKDITTNRNDGIVQNATLATDRFGQSDSAYLFNGTDSYIEMAQPIPTSASMSFSFWMTRPRPGSNQAVLFQGISAAQFDFAFWSKSENTSGSPLLVFSIKDYTTILCGLPFQQTNEWLHVVGIADAVRHLYELWIDGNLVRNYPFVGPAPLSRRYPLNVGRGSDFLNHWAYFQGKIDDIRFFPRALNSDEIASLRLEMRSKLERPKLGQPGPAFSASFQTDPQIRYGLESTSDFSTWNQKATVSGNGDEATISVAPSEHQKFFRIRRLD